MDLSEADYNLYEHLIELMNGEEEDYAEFSDLVDTADINVLNYNDSELVLRAYDSAVEDDYSRYFYKLLEKNVDVSIFNMRIPQLEKLSDIEFVDTLIKRGVVFTDQLEMQLLCALNIHYVEYSPEPNEKHPAAEYIDRGANVNYQGGFPLRLAIERAIQVQDLAEVDDALEAIELLLKAGANVNRRSNHQENGYGLFLIVAYDSGFTELFNLLIQYGADISVLDNHYTQTAHLNACEEAALKAGARLIVTTPLVLVVINFAHDMVEELLRRGADINEHNGSAIRAAYYKYDLENSDMTNDDLRMFNMLRNSGANLQVFNGQRALFQYNNSRIITQILIQEHHVIFRDNASVRLFLYVMSVISENQEFTQEQYQHVRDLIKNQGADVNFNFGLIILTAIAFNNSKLVSALLTLGANVSIRNNAALRAAFLALERSESAEIFVMLAKWGADTRIITGSKCARIPGYEFINNKYNLNLQFIPDENADVLELQELRERDQEIINDMRDELFNADDARSGQLMAAYGVNLSTPINEIQNVDHILNVSLNQINEQIVLYMRRFNRDPENLLMYRYTELAKYMRAPIPINVTAYIARCINERESTMQQTWQDLLPGPHTDSGDELYPIGFIKGDEPQTEVTRVYCIDKLSMLKNSAVTPMFVWNTTQAIYRIFISNPGEHAIHTTFWIDQNSMIRIILSTSTYFMLQPTQMQQIGSTGGASRVHGEVSEMVYTVGG